MAQVTVQRYAAELGRLPPACICCGQPAQQMVRHKFYYDPLWLIVLGPVMGIFRYLWASQSLLMFAPVCSRHGWRLGLPTYLGYFFAFSLLLLVPVLIASSQVETLRAAMGLIWLGVFLYVLGMLGLLLVVRLVTPRLVDFDTGSVTLGSVALGFKAAITGQALPGQGLRSVGVADPVFPAQVVPSPAYGSPLRAPATSNGPLIALMGIGGALAIVALGAVIVGASYISRARRNAEFRRQQADAQAFHEKSRAEAEARHSQHMADQAAKSSRAASRSTSRPAPVSSVPPSTTTSSSSTFPTSATPAASTTPPPPIAPAKTTANAAPPQADPPESGVSTPDDPFGIGQQVGPPAAVSTGGLAPKPRPDLEAKATAEPIRGRFDKPDAEAGPDGRVEVVFETHFRDAAFPATSKPLTRITDLRVGMEIWAQSRFRNWYRGTVVGIDGLRAMVHIYGWEDETDELMPITKLRVATDVEQPRDRPAEGANPFADKPAPAASSPFEDPLPPKKRTWTDSTGKFKIEAEFVKLAAGQVTLKRNDGTEIALPLDLLAAPDQAIAKKLGEM